VRKVKHLTALPYAELPSFMVALRVQGGIAARALEFTILTAARTGEAVLRPWAAAIDCARLPELVPRLGCRTDKFRK
jgi:hypothetical protein